MKPKFFIISKRDLIYVAVIAAVAIGAIIYLLGLIARASSGAPARLAIILDDFGSARDGVETALGIDRKLTCAVMPMLEHSARDARAIAGAGHEVIIHIPMQYSMSDNVLWTGNYAIKKTHRDEQIKRTVERFAASLPSAKGANIHMGSLSSTDERVMTAVIKALYEKGLYFIDSKTSSKSVCRKVANETGIGFAENDVFLEAAGKDRASIKKQLMRAAKIAKKTGKAVAIGHVGAESGITAQIIKDSINEIERMGVSFVYASELIE